MKIHRDLNCRIRFGRVAVEGDAVTLLRVFESVRELLL